uniref:COesterase domain-containing protein n=1 Tax=Strongyloides venezuelensis TaxID=75913 RepID=A0A0K0FQ90_STRVS
MGCKNSKLSVTSSTQTDDSSPKSHLTIKTNYGLVEGRTYITKDGYESNIFLGIPFASPPIGDLRFKKPIPPKRWDGILSTKKYKSRAIQRDIYIEPITLAHKKSEDCLYLNIITPDLSKTDKIYPVMVYIHGGGFAIDCAARYDYKKMANSLVRNDVIVVTIQYRLGFLGFFYTGDDSCPCNLGLWDQYMALKWIHENIQYFNGDSGNITVFGQSAGAVSTDLLSLSPYTRDMFQKVILMGGNASTIWGVGDKEKLIEICRNKAIRLGFRRVNENKEWDKEDNIQMMEFLMRLPSDKLGNSMLVEGKYFKEGFLDNAPVVDGEFIPKSIGELRKEAPPKGCVIGVCKYEGLLFMGLYKWKIDLKLKNQIINNLVDYFDKNGITLTSDEVLELGNLKNIPSGNKKIFKQRVVTLFGDIVNNVAMRRYCRERLEYHSKPKTNNLNKSMKRNSYSSGDSGFGDKTNSNESLDNLSNASCDKDTTQKPPLYLYRFDHFNRRHLMAFQLHLPFISATHSTELFYIFGVNLFVVPFIVTAEDKKVTKQVGSWWCNFAKYGNPNGEGDQNNNESFQWESVNTGSMEEYNYLKIKSNPEMGKNFGGQRIHRLAELFDEACKIDKKVENAT